MRKMVRKGAAWAVERGYGFGLMVSESDVNGDIETDIAECFVEVL